MLLRLGLTILALVAGAGPAAASLETVVAEADHVLVGLVEDRRGRELGVVALEYLKSRHFAPRLVVTVPGAGPAPTAGDRVLLALRERGDAPAEVVGGPAGLYRLQGATATALASGATVPRADLLARIRRVVGVPPPAYGGTLLVEQPVPELAREADAIVTAWVAEVRPRFTPDGESIETEVVLDVEEPLKGGLAGRVTLVLPGGAIGDVRLLAGGVPNFWPDERVLLFLTAGGARLGVAGLWQGRYTLLGDVATQPETGQVVPLARLRTRIADALAASGVVREDDEPPALAEPRFTTFCLPWTPAQVPVPFAVNPEGPGTGAPGGAAMLRLVRDAIQVWQDVPGAWIAGRFMGATTRPGTNHFDGYHDVAWADLDWLGTRVLAANFCALEGGRRIDSDTLVDRTGPAWSSTAEDGTIDLPSVVRHEFGHALGLGHRYIDCDGGPTTPLMCPAIRAGVRKGLLADDVEGLLSLYGLAGGPPESPAGLVGSARGTATVALTWSPVGALAYEVQRAAGGCAGPFQAIATLPASTGAYTDDDLGDGLPAGTYCYRLKARGPGGDSAFATPVEVRLASPSSAGLFVAVGRLGAAGRARIVTGAGAGVPARVRAFDAGGGPTATDFLAYETPFTGGVRVATCDVDGDGRDEIVTGAGPGGGPHVRVVSLDATGQPAGDVASFLAYDAGFTGGVFVACGDLDGDGIPEIVTGADAGGGPHVRVFRLAPGTPGGVVPVADLLAYDPEFRSGVRVATGRLDAGPRQALVTGAGPGGGPHVRILVLDGAVLRERGSFFAYSPSFQGGITVAAGDVTGDGRAEIVTGADAGGSPHVAVFTAGGERRGDGFLAYARSFTGGVRVAVGDLDGDGVAEVVTTPGPGGGPHVRALTAAGTPLPTSFIVP